VAFALRALVFPLGRLENLPSDRLGRRVATLLMYPNEARDRLGEFVYLTPSAFNEIGKINSALATIIEAEPIERKIAKAIRAGTINALDVAQQLKEAVQAGVIADDERLQLERARQLTAEIIAVDEFETADLVAGRARDPHRLLKSAA
jgi:acyl-CoA dehydrogenase